MRRSLRDGAGAAVARLGKSLPTVLPGGPIKMLVTAPKNSENEARENGRSRGRLCASDAQTLRER